jgi:HD-GYP domain-containing protein (c-di-GMP phosphodiesterase class II)
MVDVVSKLEKLIDVGISLSAETSSHLLLEKILESARSITNADGGTIYSVTENFVKIEILKNESLNLSYGGSATKNTFFPEIPLWKADKTPNLHNVVTYCVHKNTTVNIENSYQSDLFDFSGTRSFDGKMGYRSESFLTVPLRNHENTIIGVLQLINARDPQTKQIAPFDQINQRLVEALASQAAIAITKEQLMQGLKDLFESMIKIIADAIDRRSPYTGGHCRRVPAITMMLAEAAHYDNQGIFKDFHLNAKDFYELEVASWLHDCGKIVTPEHVIDKATKLQTIFDRIELVETRFEIVKRDLKIQMLESQIKQLSESGQNIQPNQIAQKKFEQEIEKLDAEFVFLKKSNKGGEYMRPEDQERIKNLGQIKWVFNNQEMSLLSADEIYNLCISRGTLNNEERRIINNHIDVTIDMLMSLPFPKHLKNVPEFAGGHHERMDGKGYPKGLTRDQLSIQARIMGIADVFEALTAKDRPYKPGKKLSEALEIMDQMAQSGHLDPDIYNLFLKNNIHLKYAEKFLDAAQNDLLSKNQKTA